MNLRKLALTTIFIGAGFADIVHAGSLVGDASTASDDAVFNSPTQVANKLSAVSDLVAGNVAPHTTIATGSIGSVDGSVHRYAIRLASGVSRALETGEGGVYELTGNNNTSNKLTVSLNLDVGSDWERINGNGFMVTQNAIASTIYRINTYSKQDYVNADVYTIQSEAYVYNE
ncbi:hypothetical protein [Serratia symbiotica]|uniref:Uncharacterized protein n=1 Tax=Serratia symbiotica TaxID=138074 RepID=A0A068YZZ4_9GAMM|nr:hypothetical protein [Serratia symbiotica]QLH64563.1 hypothetical protein SYMBAF_17265 [Serratia symbiotica]CDS57113.1 conserved exported hypothetical protein [Serratia symbiotica]